MSVNQTSVGVKLGMSGVLEYRDAQGNLLKSVGFSGSIPLSETGLTVEQAKQLIEDQENGSDNHR